PAKLLSELATDPELVRKRPMTNNMTKQQLKKAIEIDIKELKEILPINEGLLPSEDDTET
ncbi:11331_t:CDS:2, partial [Ambispora gerdemannii]